MFIPTGTGPDRGWGRRSDSVVNRSLEPVQGHCVEAGSSGLSTPSGVGGRLGVGKDDSEPSSLLPLLPSGDQGVAGKSLNLTLQLPGEPCPRQPQGSSLHAGPEACHAVSQLRIINLEAKASGLCVHSLTGVKILPPRAWAEACLL